MWKQILVALAVVSSPWIANAAGSRSSSTPVSYSSSSNYSGDHKHEIGVDLSVNPGLALGADYQYRGFEEHIGVGGYFHFWNKKDDAAPNNWNNRAGFFAIGGMVALHYTMDKWDAYMAPGFGIINISKWQTGANTPSDGFAMGPRNGFGFTYNFNPTIGLGFEESTYWVWTNTDYNGPVINDWAIRLRLCF
jgi:hypothetical protein